MKKVFPHIHKQMLGDAMLLLLMALYPNLTKDNLIKIMQNTKYRLNGKQGNKLYQQIKKVIDEQNNEASLQGLRANS